MATDVQRIIADPTLSPEAKVILVTAEIERQVRESVLVQPSQKPAWKLEDIEIRLMYEGVPFHPYHAPFIPRVGELISCRLEVGKGWLSTLWRVTQIEHGIGMNRLAVVTISVEPADTQTAMRLSALSTQEPSVRFKRKKNVLSRPMTPCRSGEGGRDHDARR
jgi:hypothetical protein